MKGWSPEFEMSYWNAKKDSEYYLKTIRLKYYNIFCVDRWLERFTMKSGTAIDIGGGKFGGGLRFLPSSWTKVLVDRLVFEFYAHIPDGIVIKNCDFAGINLRSNIADILFAWSVFDHANDIAHFRRGMSEVGRLLAGTGLFFGSFPLRTKPRDGHPICLTECEVLRSVDNANCTVLWQEKIGPPAYSDNVLFLIARKRAQ